MSCLDEDKFPPTVSTKEDRVGDDPRLSVEETAELVQIKLNAVDAPSVNRQFGLCRIFQLLQRLTVSEKEHPAFDRRASAKRDLPRIGQSDLVAHRARVRAVVCREEI